MRVFVAESADDAFHQLMTAIDLEGVEEESRNGKVKRFPTPITVQYKFPERRVLFHPERDWPVFFTFFEPLWMIAGRRDVMFLDQFNSGMKQYSDDGIIFNAAYGYRWVNHFGYNQLDAIVDELKKNPTSRRVILGIWDPGEDLTNTESKDLPCNVAVKFEIFEGKLRCMVFNRSNDIIYGLSTANIAQFSILQEYLAGLIGVGVGDYWQIAMNAHVYDWVEGHKRTSSQTFLYESGEISPYPMFQPDGNPYLVKQDILAFMSSSKGVYSNIFRDIPEMQSLWGRKVLKPMWESFKAYKQKNYDGAIDILNSECAAQDWTRSAVGWLLKRKQNFLSKQGG